MLRIKKHFLTSVSIAALLLAAGTADLHAQTSKADTVTITRAKPKSGVPVSGMVKDAATGKPVVGVSVAVEDFSAAITDENGRYTVNVPSYQASVLVTAEGFQTVFVALKGRKTLDLKLNDESLVSFSEPLMMPFGKKQKSDITAAAKQYNVDGAWTQPYEISDAILQGRVAGLNATRRSGAPGAGANLVLRGYNSLFGTNKPLIVVDNMLYDANDYGESIIANNYTNPLALIDAKDIDNITVLKDASSMYGTKGANGAIIITTARSKSQATQIDFGIYTGFNFAPKNLPVLDAAGYRIYLSEMLQSKGLTAAQIAALPYMNDDPKSPNYARYHYNTDWQKEVLDNSTNSNYFLKVTGGDNIATYGLSVGVVKNNGIVKATDISRYNTRFNAEFNFSKKLTGIANLAFSYNEQNLKDQGIALKTAPLYLALTKAPFLPVHEVNDAGLQSPNLADTDTLGLSNPTALIQNMEAINKYYRFFGSFTFKYDISRYLSASAMIGVTYDKVRESSFIPRKGVADDTLSNAIADSRLASQVKRLFTVYSDARVSYNRTFNTIHNISANLGIRYQHNDAEQDFALGYNSATDQLLSVQNGLNALRQIGGNTGAWNWTNTYLNVDYGFRKKMYLSFNAAVDGSSRFGTLAHDGIKLGDHKFAVSPSIGAAWIVSSENFMANSGIDLLKLRATYSITGNDDIGNYSAHQSYTSQNLLGMQGLVRDGIANPALQWESNSKLNGGIDLSLFNERLMLNFDVFKNKTTNMLVYESLATTTGFSSVLTNGGSMDSKGVELSMNARIVNRKFFKWDLGFNVGTYKNKVLAVPGGSFTTDFAGATILTANGNAPNLFYGFTSNGVFATETAAAASGLRKRNPDGSFTAFKAGDIQFADLNGDKVIDNNDRSVIGNPNPGWSGGITSRLVYKNFSLDALFTFSQGNDAFNYIRYRLEAVATTENQLVSVNNRWRTDGQVTNIPKATFGDPMGNSRFSNRWIEDASYFRLRTLSLSYNLPIKPKFFTAVNVYVAAHNLFTLTEYKGFDPEFSARPSVFAQGIDTGLDPIFRSATVGVRLGL
ncbi:MAG: SusC/RagA family TonB-linked outer membrane protein [Chitinophagaceae bacterium]